MWGYSSAGFPSINRFGLLILFAFEGTGRRIFVGDRGGDSRRATAPAGPAEARSAIRRSAS
jgi:hypothetical protein